MIDPAIALSGRPPQVNSPLDTLHGVMTIADTMQRRKLQDQQLENEKLVARQHQLAIDQHQRALDDQKALDDAAREDYERWSKEQTGTISSPVKAEPISQPAATGMDDLVQRGQPSGAQNDLVQRGKPDVTAQPLTGQQATPDLTAASLMTKRGQPQQPTTQVAQQAPPPTYAPDYMRQAQALIGKGKGHLASGLVKTHLDRWKEESEIQAKQIETALKTTEQASQMLNAVKDQQGWDVAIANLGKLGLPTKDIDPVYSEKTRDLYVARGTKLADQIRKAKDERDNLHQGLEDYGRTVIAASSQMMTAGNQQEAAAIGAYLKTIPGMSHSAIDSVLSTYNTRGVEGVRKMALTPEQTTQADAAAAARKETARHAGVTEKQGERHLAIAETKEAREAALAGLQGFIAPKGSVTVSAPDGSQHTFPNKQAADRFKKLAGIE